MNFIEMEAIRRIISFLFFKYKFIYKYYMDSMHSTIAYYIINVYSEMLVYGILRCAIQANNFKEI